MSHSTSNRLKDAIRDKLVELDCYIDKELPDYIIAMVNNKKPRQEMHNELELFLSEKSQIFTDWIFNLLEKMADLAENRERKKTALSSKSLKRSKVIKPKEKKRVKVDIEPKKEKKFKSKEKEEKSKSHELSLDPQKGVDIYTLPGYVEKNKEEIDELVNKGPVELQSNNNIYTNKPDTKFLITLNGADNIDQDTLNISTPEKTQFVETYGLLTKKKRKNIQNKKLDVHARLGQTPVEGDDTSISILKEKKIEIIRKCQYWPDCRAKDECVYIHPTQQCTKFPDCSYGQKCVYIHPNCKFGVACANPSCGYQHSLFTNINNATECKYHPYCNNNNCQFYHKPVCRYGTMCNKGTDCIFFHAKKTENPTQVT